MRFMFFRIEKVRGKQISATKKKRYNIPTEDNYKVMVIQLIIIFLHILYYVLWFIFILNTLLREFYYNLYDNYSVPSSGVKLEGTTKLLKELKLVEPLEGPLN